MVIYDLNGEWAVSVEHCGAWEKHGISPDIIAIKQEGGSFVGVTLLGSTSFKIGDKKIIGELSKNSFKEVKIISRIGALYSNGKIIENGNKIIVNYDDLLKLTMIRRP